ncbi:MAG: hypothetical protein OEZ23_07475, partial [Gammaproteobacteria bacterium]|nr:hypothetical protein [Gammaproteobacteria bacterium]
MISSLNLSGRFFNLLLISFVISVLNLASAFAQSSNSNNGSQENLKIGLSGTFTIGGSSLHNEDIQILQAGGHDPNKNGFTVQNIELSISGTVDPWLDAQANIIMLIDAEGETVIELEEAFITTRQLPAGLQIKAGQYYTEFGRRNQQHPHQWLFVDQPVILSRLFGGDGLRSQGLRLSWLMPAPWYSELYFGIQNASGETVASFLGEPDQDIGGHLLLERQARNFSDLLYSARWLNGLDVSDTVSLNLGISALSGPNATGEKTETDILGMDIYLKWQPLNNQRGFPFVSWHTEYLKREYEALDSFDPLHEELEDKGFFSQLTWGFSPGWTTGLRFEKADSNGNDPFDASRNDRDRLSLNFSWFPSEYSKVRLQYNRDNADHLIDEPEHSVWLQFEFNLGSHMAHTF